jgi:hypothetical protein
MKDKSLSIELKCLFCHFPLEGDSIKEYVSRDLLECQNCHELNDYDALIKVATEAAKGIATEYVKKEVEKIFKDVFKK